MIIYNSIYLFKVEPYMIRKPSKLNVFLYLYIKYIILCVILAFLDNRFKNIVLDNSNGTSEILESSAGYILYCLFAILAIIVFLFIPMYLIFKLKNRALFLAAFIAIIVFECFLYGSIYSDNHWDKQEIINALLSIAFLPLFFWKFIASLRYPDYCIDKSI